VFVLGALSEDGENSSQVFLFDLQKKGNKFINEKSKDAPSLDKLETV